MSKRIRVFLEPGTSQRGIDAITMLARAFGCLSDGYESAYAVAVLNGFLLARICLVEEGVTDQESKDACDDIVELLPLIDPETIDLAKFYVTERIEKRLICIAFWLSDDGIDIHANFPLFLGINTIRICGSCGLQNDHREDCPRKPCSNPACKGCPQGECSCNTVRG